MNDVLRSGGGPADPPPAAAPKAAPPAQASPPPAPPGKGDVAEPFPGPANPLDLEATGDEKRQAKARIGKAGGSLKTTGADGATYELTIPPKALGEEVEITMTPIASIKGLSEPDTHGFGVILEPHGVILAETGALTITKARMALAPDAFAFTGQGSGKDARMEIAKLAGETAMIPIDGFSIYGVRTHGAGLTAERQRVAAAVPYSQADRLRHRIAATAGRDQSLVSGYLRDFWRLLEATEASRGGGGSRTEACRSLRLAAAAYVRSIVAARNAGMSLPDFVEAHMITMRQWSFLHFECRQEAEEMCRRTFDPSHIQRQAIAECDAGGRSFATHGGLACEAAGKWSREAIERCMPDNLVIRAKSRGTYTDMGRCRQLLELDVTIRVKLTAGSIPGYREGWGGHVVREYKHDYPDCPCNPRGRDIFTPISAITAAQVHARVKIEPGADGSPQVRIWLDPGRINLRWSFRTCGGSSDTIEDADWWRSNFLAHFRHKLEGGRVLFDPMPHGTQGAAYTQFNGEGSYPMAGGIWKGKEEAIVTIGNIQ